MRRQREREKLRRGRGRLIRGRRMGRLRKIEETEEEEDWVKLEEEID